MKMAKIIVLTTGGTVEKTYDELQGILQNKEPLIDSFVKQRLRLPYTQLMIRPILAKDSLDMTDADRQLIAHNIQLALSEECPVLVLHGTDTMENSARYCFENLPKPALPVVFTGAMRPLGYENSDAPQNLIEALMACQLAAPGLYICFHNHLFEIPNVRKNKSLGTFEEISV